jgi:hypothetical protein
MPSISTSNEFSVLRWVLLPIGVLAAFAVGALAGERVGVVLQVWTTPPAVFLAACLMILAAYIIAPRYKLQVAAVTLLPVVTVAWHQLEPSVDPRTYEPTHLPFLAALAGGLVGLSIAALLKGKARVA